MQTLELKYLDVYGAADPAAGSERASSSRQSARQTIIIAARDHLQRWFELYSWAGRITATQYKDKILDLYDEYRPRRFGIEANGLQVLFGGLLKTEAKERFVETPRFFPVYQPRVVKKEYRIRTGLEPVINERRLFIRSKVSPLALEINGFPTAATCDLVDCLETLISRVAFKFVSDKAKDQNLERYASYLRNTGCPPHLLEQKIEAYKRRSNN